MRVFLFLPNHLPTIPMTDKPDMSKEREALRTIAEWPITQTGQFDAMDAVNMKRVAQETLAALSLPAAGQEPVAWPKDAAEVREFFNANFISAQFAAPDQSPCDEDRYYISAHDFLSAVNWWADFPHFAAPQPAVAAGWMPIEKAPKDGTVVLLAGNNGRTADGSWAVKPGLWIWPYVLSDPTHWMPLPPPPHCSIY